MDRKAQGLPITTIIIVALGLVVLVILFAAVTGRLQELMIGTKVCQGTCVQQYKAGAPNVVIANNRDCLEIETDLGKGHTLKGQASGVAAEERIMCGSCCV